MTNLINLNVKKLNFIHYSFKQNIIKNYYLKLLLFIFSQKNL